MQPVRCWNCFSDTETAFQMLKLHFRCWNCISDAETASGISVNKHNPCGPENSPFSKELSDKTSQACRLAGAGTGYSDLFLISIEEWIYWHLLLIIWPSRGAYFQRNIPTNKWQIKVRRIRADRGRLRRRLQVNPLSLFRIDWLHVYVIWFPKKHAPSPDVKI